MPSWCIGKVRAVEPSSLSMGISQSAQVRYELFSMDFGSP